MNQTTLTRKSILAAACFCLATSLAAQTNARQESTSVKDNPTAQDAQMVASLNHPASTPTMPLAYPSTVTPAPAPVETPKANLLASSSLPIAASLSAATAVRWTAPGAVTDHASTDHSSRKSWVSVEPGTVPPAPLYQEAPSSNPYGPAPAFANLKFGHK